MSQETDAYNRVALRLRLACSEYLRIKGRRRARPTFAEIDAHGKAVGLATALALIEGSDRGYGRILDRFMRAAQEVNALEDQ